jgi:hypothetical protein
MLWMIYVILRRLCLVNEQNAMINMKKDMVKNIKKLDNKKTIPSILALKKPSRYMNCSTI